jgi:dethiobiotin synthetase
MKGKVYFITGIDTNIGKTYATALLANRFTAQGKRVITQKMIQTGCLEISEDIVKHRELQQIELLPEDKTGITCPYLFSYPCSPHLAASIDGSTIDCNVITQATEQLQQHYEIVLLEGAGGLMVPIDQTQTTIDYVVEL